MLRLSIFLFGLPYFMWGIREYSKYFIEYFVWLATTVADGLHVANSETFTISSECMPHWLV